MALLRANIDATTIRLMGRWKLWCMLQYLHRSAMDTTTFASRMIIGGNYTISKHASLPLPDDIIPLVESTMNLQPPA